MPPFTEVFAYVRGTLRESDSLRVPLTYAGTSPAASSPGPDQRSTGSTDAMPAPASAARLRSFATVTSSETVLDAKLVVCGTTGPPPQSR